jgi:hypothetical protein
MVWTSDVTVDVLDLLAFFLAAPDLIGKSRLDEFEKNIDGALTRSVPVGHWARAKISILRQWAWRIFGVIIVTYAVLGSILQWVFPDSFENRWVNSLPFWILVYVCAALCMVIYGSFIVAGLLRLLFYSLSALLSYLERRHLSGLLLLIGATVFVVARGVSVAKHLSAS